MLQTHAYRLQRKELSDYDVLLTIGFKYRRYSLQRWTGISTYFRKRRAGSIRYWGLPCCNNRRWFLPYFHRVSSVAVGVGLIHTNDWKNYTRHGMIFPPHNKDCALFRTEDRWQVFCSSSPKQSRTWRQLYMVGRIARPLALGKPQCVATTRDGMWDCARVGAGAAPIKTEEGWLEIYHGADF